MITVDQLNSVKPLDLGTDWGERLWRFEGDGWAFESHGATADDAKANAVKTLEGMATAVTPSILTIEDVKSLIVAALPTADVASIDAVIAQMTGGDTVA